MRFAALHHVEQPVAVEHLPRMVAKGAQHAEFGRGERHQRAVRIGQPMLERIELPAFEFIQEFVIGRGRCRALGTAQYGTDPGDKFARLERLGHIIVGADFQADDPVHRFAFGGQQNSGQAPAFDQMAA